MIHGQESHYWMTQVGARSTMLCGAVVGSVRDNSAIYYNPGAQAFINNSSFAVVGDVFFHDYLEMDNAAGDGINLYNHALEANPQLVSGVIKNPKRPAITINYAFLNRHISRVNLNARKTMSYDVYESIPGEELYNASFDYEDRAREDWLGAGYGFKLSDNFGIGFSLFLTFRSQQNRLLLDISVMDSSQTVAPPALNGSNYGNTNLDYLSVGFLPKIGYAFDYEKLKIGGTVTFPRLPVYLFTRVDYLRSEQYLVTTISDETYKAIFHQRKIKGYYKSPWIVDLGLQYIENKNKYFFTVAWFSKIEKYNLIKPKDIPEGSVDDILIADKENFKIVNMAHRAVVNFALGYERKLSEQFNFMLSFSTDFNATDWNKIDAYEEYTPFYSTWDIYHVAGGVELETDRLVLTLGVNFGIGRSKDQWQIFNLSSPSDESLLLGELNNNVNSRFLRSSIVVGFIYNFPDINQGRNKN